MTYVCPWCKVYTTTLKTNLKRHMNRKRKCIKQSNHPESSENPSLFANSTLNNLSNKWVCEHCDKTFSTNSNMNRHKRLSCKEARKNNQIRKLEEENKQLKSVITNQIAHNITNIHFSNTTINNNNTNNIHINAFGMENTDHLKTTILYCLKQNDYTQSMVKLTQLTYNDPMYPQNHTVLIKNDRTKFAKISDGEGNMKDYPRKDVVVCVIDKNKTEFEQCIKEHPSLEYTPYGLNHVRTKSTQEQKDIFNAVECALINKSMPTQDEMKEIIEERQLCEIKDMIATKLRI